MHMTRLLAVVATLALSVGAAPAVSPEPPAGASSCTGCHAARANVQTPVPPLNGRDAIEIVQQMQAFRAGQREGTVMDRIAKGFTDAELQAIASWYAAQQ
jgi:cytochrome c553